MPWGEAIRLTAELAQDPSSHVAAALADLKYPVSRSAVVLMDLYDLTHQIAATQGGSKQRPKPYPRPWTDQSDDAKRFGGASMTPDELRAVLNKHRTEATDD